MTGIDREAQAAAFVEYHRRVGGYWFEIFSRWAAGKHFDPRDEWAIQRIVRQELIALNYVTVTDEEAA